ncbi:hypothetical protein LguiB_010704 [Lonicera macranthoides]
MAIGGEKFTIKLKAVSKLDFSKRIVRASAVIEEFERCYIDLEVENSRPNTCSNSVSIKQVFNTLSNGLIGNERNGECLGNVVLNQMVSSGSGATGGEGEGGERVIEIGERVEVEEEEEDYMKGGRQARGGNRTGKHNLIKFKWTTQKPIQFYRRRNKKKKVALKYNEVREDTNEDEVLKRWESSFRVGACSRCEGDESFAEGSLSRGENLELSDLDFNKRLEEEMGSESDESLEENVKLVEERSKATSDDESWIVPLFNGGEVGSTSGLSRGGRGEQIMNKKGKLWLLQGGGVGCQGASISYKFGNEYGPIFTICRGGSKAGNVGNKLKMSVFYDEEITKGYKTSSALTIREGLWANDGGSSEKSQEGEGEGVVVVVKERENAMKRGMQYMELKQLLLLSYCQAITFYLLLKSEGQPVRDHPVIARLVEIKNLLDKMKKLDENLPSDLEEILDKKHGEMEAKFPSEDTGLESLSKDKRSMVSAEKQVPDEALELVNVDSLKDNENKVAKRKHPSDQVALQSVEMLKVRAALEEKLKQKGVFNSVAPKRNGARKNLQTMNGKLETLDDFDDDAVDINAYRVSSNGNPSLSNSTKLSQLVTKAKKAKMEKNRGLTRSRKKLTKNPRKKYRGKHEKMKVRRKGQVRDIKKPSGPYGGETSGINAGISRSIRFKS